MDEKICNLSRFFYTYILRLVCKSGHILCSLTDMYIVGHTMYRSTRAGLANVPCCHGNVAHLVQIPGPLQLVLN